MWKAGSKTPDEVSEGARGAASDLCGTLTAFIAASAALLVYWVTLAPTVTGEDSGELIAAAYCLGIPHPPGYPLWTLIAHAFTLIDHGTVAWRVNLVSAVFGAGTVFLLSRLIHAITRSPLASLSAALGFAFSREFWEQSVIAEVYTLNAFLLTGCLLVLWRWRQHGCTRCLYAFAVLFGLGLANHYTMHLMAPLFAMYILAIDRAPIRSLPKYGRMILLSGGIAVGLYAYLPLRSAMNPSVDWGNPETLGNFLKVIGRDQYGFMLWQYPRSLARFGAQLGAFGAEWRQQFGLGIGLAGLLGFLPLLRRNAGFAYLLMCVACIAVVGFTLIQNFGLDREWRWVMSVFWIPAYLSTAIGIGAMVAWLLRWRWRCPGIAFAVAAVLVPLVLHWEHNNRARDFWAEDYGRNVLESMAKNAVFVPYSDHAAFTVIHLQTVEGLRTDVSLARKYGYFDVSLVDDMPPEQKVALGAFPRRREEPKMIQWILEHGDRPVYFTKKPLDLPQGITVKQHGLLFRALREGERGQEQPWDTYRWHSFSPEVVRGDYTASLILFEVAMAKAIERFDAGDGAAGVALLNEGITAYGRDSAFLNNAGVLCGRYGQVDAARRYFEEAMARNPYEDAPARNLARTQ